MAVLYGAVTGIGETPATRRGSKKSGIKSSVQSYHGSVITRLYYDENDELKVVLEMAAGSDDCGYKVFDGTFSELAAQLAK